jgi:hypothetical protein
LVFPKPRLARMKDIASEFEALHDIPLILRTIDGGHIFILVSSHDPAAYYSRK